MIPGADDGDDQQPGADCFRDQSPSEVEPRVQPHRFPAATASSTSDGVEQQSVDEQHVG